MTDEPKQLNLEEWTRAMLASTQQSKEMMSAHHGGPYDLQPMLHVVDVDGGSYIGMIPDRDAIAVGVQAIRDETSCGDPAFIGVCADAVMRSYPAGTTPPEVQRGEVLRQFGLGDFTVTEQLVVSVIDVKTDEIKMLHLPYRIGDAGMPVFDEPVEVTDQGGVAIHELRKAARRSRA